MPIIIYMGGNISFLISLITYSNGYIDIVILICKVEYYMLIFYFTTRYSAIGYLFPIKD
jgi:hypothetical protein